MYSVTPKGRQDMTNKNHVSPEEAAATAQTRANFDTGLPKALAPPDSPADTSGLSTDKVERAARLRAHFSTG